MTMCGCKNVSPWSWNMHACLLHEQLHVAQMQLYLHSAVHCMLNVVYWRCKLKVSSCVVHRTLVSRSPVCLSNNQALKGSAEDSSSDAQSHNFV